MKNLWWFLSSVFIFLITLTQTISAAGGHVALQTADPSCADDSGNIYVDCGNGTVTDNRSGLVWLQNANCFGIRSWMEAMTIIDGLSDQALTSVASEDDCGLEDGSSPGEWRLPSASEWEAMVSTAMDLGGCTGLFGVTLTNDAGDACYGDGASSSFENLPSSGSLQYWSSTSALTGTADAWFTVLNYGYTTDMQVLNEYDHGTVMYVWPVRGGQ